MNTQIQTPAVVRMPWAGGCMALLALAFSSGTLQAAATTDGTAGRVVTLTGHFTVPQTLGTVAGANLFHSFQSFSIGPGESATFTTATTLQNVIARVTGGLPSTFHGPLRLSASEGGKPGLFFINPAGITLGAGSSVDVPGALHLSTANYLKLADGSAYQAELAKGSTFSAAAPQAFGFLGARTGPIRLQDKADMTLVSGEPLSLTAANLQISNTNISSLGGQLRFVAVGSTAVELGITGPLPPVSGQLVVDNGALIVQANLRAGDAGEVAVAAGDVVIGPPHGSAATGITSYATGSGVGGPVRFNATHSMTVQNGGQVQAIAEQAAPAGDVQVTVGGALRVQSGSAIASVNTGSGASGTVKVTALGSIVLDGGGTNVGAGIGSESAGVGAAGDVVVVAGAGLSMVNGGRISSSTFHAGQGGLVKVEATSLAIDNQGAPSGTGIASNSAGSGHAGAVEVKVSGPLDVVGGGLIQSSAYGTGKAGAVSVTAHSIRLRNSSDGKQTGIVSETGGSGDAGQVLVQAHGELLVQDSARISSSSFASGHAGAVRVSSASLSLQGGRSATDSSAIVSVSKDSGNAGTVEVSVHGLLSITSGMISSSTESTGQGGSVHVSAGSIAISNAQPAYLSGITSDTSGQGRAGSVSVTASDAVLLKGGGIISSSTYAQGAAGAVTVTAGTVNLNGAGSPFGARIASETEGSGQAGTVAVVARGALTVAQQAAITSSAYASGDAGLVRVQAGTITIDGQGGRERTGIGSVAFSGRGNGGSVEVSTTGTLSMLLGAEISSDTSSPGVAGTVKVSGEHLVLASGSSINSGARLGSGGRTGNVSVFASKTLTLTDSRLSIENRATVAQPGGGLGSTLQVKAQHIDLVNSEITASASGNLAASNIVIDQAVQLAARAGSAINTSAVTGQGGSVVLGGGGALLLDRSRLTTSITGTNNGDGGPIRIDAPVIVLNSGFVQANTAVASARGGDVSINLNTPQGVLIASGQQLITGGQPVRFQLAGHFPNVIQAARPDGVNGTLQVASPRIDLSASLAILASPQLDFGTLGADLCRAGDGSSLTPVGRGGLKPGVAERVRPSW